MGDRTWLQLTIRKDDINKVNEIFGYDLCDAELNEPDNTSVTGYYDEVNYGGSEELEELAYSGITFIAQHGSGGGYGAYEIVCFLGEQQSSEIGYEGGFVVETHYEDGEVIISKDSLSRIKNWYRIENLARKHLDNCQEPEFLAEVAKRRLTKGMNLENT